jgi:predicted MPP superfamily phosphohydrolase
MMILMSNLVCGDLHCKTDLAKLVVDKFENGNYDKLVFIGDYVDSFTHSDTQMLECLNYIIETKKRLGDKCILLWGNHEYSYMESHYRASGWRKSIATVVYQLLTENKDLFQWYYFDSGTLYTHAGVNTRWYKQALLKINEKYPEFKIESLFELLDFCQTNSFGTDLLCQCGEARGGYRYDKGGILWCDKKELLDDRYFDDVITNQVVGHTATKDIEVFASNLNKNQIIFTDCLGSKTKFYES